MGIRRIAKACVGSIERQVQEMSDIVNDIEVTEDEIPGVKAIGLYTVAEPADGNPGMVFVLLEDGSVRWRVTQAAEETE